MRTAFSIDPDQGLAERDELQLVRLAAELGYAEAWTPARADTAAFERCLRWSAAGGLPVGISVAPASGQPAAFYAEHARRVWEATDGAFTLGVGSGRMAHAASGMRTYLAELRRLVPPEMPLQLAALGLLMLRVAGELADGVALNWCTVEQVAWSRAQVADAASRAGRAVPRIVEYIRTSVDADGDLAGRTLGAAVGHYALGPAPYRRHFERMGFADELTRVSGSGADWSPGFLSAVGAWGTPGSVHTQVERLAAGLDLPVVRVLVTRRGDAGSARAVLQECAPGVDGS